MSETFANKSCSTCIHKDFNDKCERVGWYCSTELKYNGKCSKSNGDLVLWSKKPSFGTSIRNFIIDLFGVKK